MRSSGVGYPSTKLAGDVAFSDKIRCIVTAAVSPGHGWRPVVSW